MLVLIDGLPQLRDIQGTKLQRVINTRAVLLFENDKKTYYLRVQDWWLQATELEGPWTYAKKLPDDMKKAEEYIVSQTLRRPCRRSAQSASRSQQSEAQPSLKEAGKNAEDPRSLCGVRAGGTDRDARASPSTMPIPGTGLEYVENTNGNIFRLSGEYYVLISGRWFKGAVTRWTMDVRGGQRAATPTSRRFLWTVRRRPFWRRCPGRRRPRKALIANSIPQTATITRSEAKLTVEYDGEATFRSHRRHLDVATRRIRRCQ